MRVTRGRWAGALLLGLAALGGAARADDPPVVVRLRSGEELRGTLLGFGEGRFRVRTERGERALAEADVLELRVEAPPAPVPAEGQPAPEFRALHEPPTLRAEGQPGGVRLTWRASEQSCYVVVRACLLERRAAGSDAWDVLRQVDGHAGEWVDTGAEPERAWEYRVTSLAVIDKEDPVVQQYGLTLPPAEARRASEPSRPVAAVRDFRVHSLAISPAGGGARELLLEVQEYEGGAWQRRLARVADGGALELAGQQATLRLPRQPTHALSAELVLDGRSLAVSPAAADGVRVLRVTSSAAPAQARPLREALASDRLVSLELDQRRLDEAAVLLAGELGVSLCGLDLELARPVSLRLRGVPLREAWRLFLAATKLEATAVGEVLCLHDADRRAPQTRTVVDPGPLAGLGLDADLSQVVVEDALQALCVTAGADLVLSASARQVLADVADDQPVLSLGRLRGASLPDALGALCAAAPGLRWTARGKVLLVYRAGERWGPEDTAELLLKQLSHPLLQNPGTARSEASWPTARETLQTLLSPRLRAAPGDAALTAWLQAWKDWEQRFDGPRDPVTLVRALRFEQDAQGRWCLDGEPPALRSPGAASPGAAGAPAAGAPADPVEARLQAGDWQGALDLLQARKPADVSGLLQRARAWIGLGRPASAQDDLREALRLEPRNPSALLLLARVHLQQGQVSQAEAPLEALLVLTPDDPRVHALRAKAHAAAGGWTEALKAAERALELDPRSCEALKLSGWALLRQKRPQEALDRFRRALELEPLDSDAWSLRASARAWLNDLEGAISDMSRALELAPEHREALDRQRALREWQQARGAR